MSDHYDAIHAELRDLCVRVTALCSEVDHAGFGASDTTKLYLACALFIRSRHQMHRWTLAYPDHPTCACLRLEDGTVSRCSGIFGCGTP